MKYIFFLSYKSELNNNTDGYHYSYISVNLQIFQNPNSTNSTVAEARKFLPTDASL